MDYDAINKVGEHRHADWYDDELGLGHTKLEVFVKVPDG